MNFVLRTVGNLFHHYHLYERFVGGKHILQILFETQRKM